MSRKIAVTVSFEIALGEPVALSNLEAHRNVLLARGVYFLHDGAPNMKAFVPYTDSVVYIGKAIGETVFSRCRKHRAALRDERLPSGQPSMRPGMNFKAWRAAIAGSLQNVWIIPGFMNAENLYLISCAEEYLLHEYARRNGGSGPRANTK